MVLRHASGSAIVLYSTAAIKQIQLIIILFSPNLGSNVEKEKKKTKKQLPVFKRSIIIQLGIN